MTINLNLGDIVQLEHQVRVKRAQRGWQAEVASLRQCIGNALVSAGVRLGGTTPVVAGRLEQNAV